MNTYMNALKKTTNFTYTENQMLTHKTTESAVLDMFGQAAAYRNRSDDDCILLFKNAFEEDAELAMKCLFWVRDIRGGAGERRFFRVCYRWLAQNYPEIALKNIEQVVEMGRVDDLYCLVDTPIEKEMFTFLYYMMNCAKEEYKNVKV